MRKFTDSVILVLNLVSAAGLLVAYLAPFVNPARSMIPALFGLAYPYLLLGNLVFIIYWMIRLKKWVLISLLVTLAGWNHLNNLLPLNLKGTNPPSETSSDRIFTVMSYNIRGFDRFHWSGESGSRSGIFQFIREQRPDILCFQEFFTTPETGETEEAVSRLLQRLPYSAVYYTAGSKNRNGYGIATYSSYPILKRSRIPFNSFSNAAMYTDLLIQHDTIRVFNVHLQSVRFHPEDYAFLDTARITYSSQQVKEIKSIGSRLKTAFELRSEQATMIAGYIRNSPYPVIVMGDFNDTPQSFAYRQIRKGLQDAFRKAGRGFGNTYSGELPSFRIDHIMVGDPMIPYRFKRIKTDYSDHFPLTALIYLPAPGEPEP